uniref:Uncharacterized protein n=1 Tax=Ananas comosus var. bracteatus TaxID=296719 RepID=A0A6V7P2M7_ANACO|nr:unnamed protein product [Ananas comosus var. bracteatus]
MTFAVHGSLGTFDHAILEAEYLREGGQPARKELFYVDLSSQTHERVKSIVIECTTLLKADTSGVFHDSVSSFYDALCGDIPLSAPAYTPAATVVAPPPLQSSEPISLPPLPIEPVSLAQPPPEPEFTGDRS